MNSRKQLIKEIRDTKAEVDYHRLKAYYHEKYFLDFLKESYLMIIAALLPVFFLGWNNGRLVKKTGRIVFPIFNFLMSLFFYSQKKKITRL